MNPRRHHSAPQSLSRRPPSTTRPPLQVKRRAGDSNPQGPLKCPADFKSAALPIRSSPPSLKFNRDELSFQYSITLYQNSFSFSLYNLYIVSGLKSSILTFSLKPNSNRYFEILSTSSLLKDNLMLFISVFLLYLKIN